MMTLGSTRFVLHLLLLSTLGLILARPSQLDAGVGPGANDQLPLLAPSSSASVSVRERYDGQSVWRVDWTSLDGTVKDQVIDAIHLLNLDIWHASPSTLDIRLNTHQLNVIQSYLPLGSINPFIPNLQTLIEDTCTYSEDEIAIEMDMDVQKKKNKKKGKKEKLDPFNLTTISTPFHDTYHPLEDLYKFGDVLMSTFSGKPLTNESESDKFDLKTFVVGKTFEGREIRGFSAKIVPCAEEDSQGGSSGMKRGREDREEDITQELEFIVQSGQHGREWVGPSSALYFLHSLLIAAMNEPTSESALLLRSFTFTVIPSVNPDGLEYSREHSRLWRKNRQEIGAKSCLGIDLNSNWGYKWRPSKAAACSDAYPGKAAFEAYESRAVSEYLSSAAERGTKIRAFVDLHSYGQLFMFPFAHSCADFPPDAEMLMEAGLGVAKAMRSKKGEGYEAGQACDLTYRAPGDAIDYSYGITDVRWSYSAELRDTGTYGFLLPSRLIRATAEEAAAGLQYLAKFIYTLEVAP